MARVVPVQKTDVRTTRTAEGVRIDLRRRRPLWRWLATAWVAILFPLGLVDMLVGGPPEASGGALFMVLWGVIGTVVVGTALWGLLQREHLVVGEKTLTHTRSIGPLRKASAYERTAIDDVRVNTEANRFDPRTSYWFYGIGSGSVTFDYGRRTIRVADVDEAEAKRIVDALAAAGL